MKTTIENINEAINFACTQLVEDYEERVSRAWDIIAKNRCPLFMADSELFEDIMQTFEDYCEDYELDPNLFEDFDPEEVISC